MRIRLFATSLIYTETESPKGSANKIANALTHRVPPISGSIPNCAAGVAVGNHSVPNNTSLMGIALSFKIRLLGFWGINSSGIKAIIPGVIWMRESILVEACSYSFPSSVSVK